MHVWYDRLCETEVKSRGGGELQDSLHNTGGGGKMKRHILLQRLEGGKNDQNRRYVIFERPLIL